MRTLYNNKVLSKFILIQPIIDIITSIMINEFNLSISLGMIIRFVFFLYTFIYIFQNRDKKINIYLLIWIVYGSISLIGNYMLKENFNIISHGVSLIKMFYFPCLLLFYYLYFKKHEEINKAVFVDTSILVGLSLILSVTTKTTYCSYASRIDCLKYGVLAWFNSANEYGIILIALLGLTLVNFIKKTNVFNIIAVMIISLFLAVLGTKTSYIGLIGVLLVYSIYFIITCLINHAKLNQINKLIYIIVILCSVFFMTDRLPIYTNLVKKYDQVTEEVNKDYCENKTDTDKKTEEEKEETVKNTIMFSGRDDFVKINKQIYKNSTLFNKLFGITNQGNYLNGEEYNHIVERDFHDLLIIYGIFGFIIELILPVYLIIKIIKKIIKNMKILLSDEIILIGLVLGMILIISFIAGHCLFQPAVSIYLAYLFNILYKKVNEFE